MKYRFITKVLLVGFCAVVPSGCRYFAPRQMAKEALENTGKKAKGELDKLKNATLTGSDLSGTDDQGRLAWKVSAEKIHALTGAQSNNSASNVPNAELINAKAILYDKGNPESQLTAPRIHLVYQEDGNVQLILSGGVTVISQNHQNANKKTSQNPVTITTPQATINVKKRQIWSDHGVKAIQGKGNDAVQVTSKTLLANTSLKTADMNGDVTATTARGVMTGQKVRWNWKNGQLTAEGGVKAQNQKRDVTLTGQSLKADTRAHNVTLSGSITATTARGVITGQGAKWNWINGQLTVDSGVKMRGTGKDNNFTLSGQHLTANTNTHIVTVTGGVTADSADGSATAQKVLYHWDNGKLDANGNVYLKGKGATVSAAAVQTTREMKNATATGNVRVVRGDLNITASSATVTKMGESTFSVVGNGGVTMRNADGRASADSATWKKGQITAKGHVKLWHGGYTLMGSSLTTDDQFTNATLIGNTSGTMPGNGDLSAGKVIYNKGKIIATGGVAGRRDKMRLRADRLESNATGDLVELSGNVTLLSDDGTTVKAPQARYDRKKNQIYAWGGVTLHDEKRQLTQQGKTLTADLNLKEAVLTDVSGSGKMNVLDGKNLF